MEAISAIGIFSSFIYALLLINKKGKSFADRVLIVWMFVFVIHLILPLMMAMGNRFFIEKVNGLDIGLYTLHLTFLYFYALSLTQCCLKLKWSHLWFLAPTATVYIVQYFFDSNVHLFQPLVDHYFLGINKLFHLFGVVSLNLIFCTYFSRKLYLLLQRHQYLIADNFSYSENVDLKWLSRINYFAYTLTVLIFIFLILLIKGMLNEEWINNIYFSAFSIFPVVLGFEGYRQGNIFTLSPENENPKTNNSCTGKIIKKFGGFEFTKQDNQTDQNLVQTTDNSDQFISDLKHFMVDQKPHLDPKLNIGMMANALDIQPYVLSRLINQHFSKNFFEFINDHRIEEFKKLAADPKNKHFSILGLAFDSGFNSKASFNRIFKSSTGLTPSQFRENFQF